MASWNDPTHWARMLAGAECQVCQSRTNALIELEGSWVLVGPADPVIGYACLVFSRHAVELHDLTDTEAALFARDARKVSQAIASLVRPVKMNYEIHGNTAPHLHMHFFPRYRGDQFENGPINPRAARRPAYGVGEFGRFADALRRVLGQGGA